METQQLQRAQREQLLGQRGAVVWFTGLSGAGKTTLARALAAVLHADAKATYSLDGDTLREGLCSDLGFSPADREENIRRVGEVAALMADAGLIVTAAFISPYAAGRAAARRACAPGRFFEVHVATPLETCRQRDVKGLYRRAIAGELSEFTGVSAPYERPEAPDLVVCDAGQDLSQSLEAIIAHLRAHRVLERAR